MSDLTINDLWKVVDADSGTGVMRTHEDEFVMEPVTPADLRAAIENEGADESEALGLWWTSRLSRELAVANEPDDAEVFVVEVDEPGTYLVWRVEEES